MQRRPEIFIWLNVTLLRRVALEICVNIGSGNGTMPLPKPMLISQYRGSMAFTLDQSDSEHPSYYSV